MSINSSFKCIYIWCSFFFVLLLLLMLLSPIQSFAEDGLIQSKIWIDGSTNTSSKEIAVQVSVFVESPELQANNLSLSYHIYGEDGELLLFEGARTPLIGFDNNRILNIPIYIDLDRINTTASVKSAQVQFDIVNETIGYWFSTSPGIALETDVVTYEGGFVRELRESAAKALQRPGAILVNFLSWLLLILLFIKVKRDNITI